MIRSMTGYGSADLERDGQRLSAEIRSVNHRYCEVSLRAPKMVALFEDQIRQLVQDRYSRGKFNLTITWSGAGDSGEVLKLNEAVADRYVSLFRQLESRYQVNASLDVRTLATLPDVFSWEHTAMSDEETWELVKTLVGKACEITPGLESPTVSELRRPDWSAVRAMVPRTATNRVMDDLYALGARAILVTQIHACRL